MIALVVFENAEIHYVNDAEEVLVHILIERVASVAVEDAFVINLPLMFLFLSEC